MQQPYFVTGLPRSGTAWFAAATTIPGVSFCAHEPVRDFETWEDLRDNWIQPGPLALGISDHALGFQIDRVLQEVRPRTLIVDRPFSESLQSFEAYMAGTPFSVARAVEFMTELMLKLNAVRDPLVKRMRFADIRNPQRVQEALQWLVPAADFSSIELVEAAMRHNIQADKDQVLREIETGPRPTWWAQ